jgi:hypothetical protein
MFRKPILLLLALLPIIAIGAFWMQSAKNSEPAPAAKKTNINSHSFKNYISSTLEQKAARIKTYSMQKGFDTSICFLLDMNRAPGQNRFFVYDMNRDSVLMMGLVAHGSGGKSTFEKPAFSNNVGSNCTSLGRYKIGTMYYGQFGRAYKLHGLDATNSNAFNRFVVLHAHDCVPDSEISPYPICMSWGCPTVSPDFLEKLALQIGKTDKPVVMEIFNGNR